MSAALNSLARDLEEMEDQRDALDAMLAHILTFNEESVPWSLVKRLSAGENPIRVWREFRDLHPRELALQVGVSEAHIRELEDGQVESGLAVAARIARALQIDLNDLVLRRRTDLTAVTDLQPVRGTRDLIGDDMRRHSHVIDTARSVAASYGLDEWATPIFEDTRVFARTLGDTSDVVTKEMYSFTDRGGDSITLRPEMTAGVCRALVTNGLTQSLPQKVFYAGPMFRYERPQKGRYRQFHQIGAELIGPSEPLADAEVIACGWDILRALGIADDVVLELNTLGDRDSRDAYRAGLVAYFTENKASLSEDSLARLERNPMRILDSKDEGDRSVVAGAPTITPHLTEAAATFYQRVQDYLARFGVPFRENPRIVRGLDYYSHTAFEFVTSRLGAQGTVMAGGRYDGLVAEMGGPPTAAVGWASGIERLAMLLTADIAPPRGIAVVPLGDATEAAALGIVQALRHAGLRAEMAYRGNLKRRMERANRIRARFAVIVGESEIAAGAAQVKDLDSGTQESVPFAELPNRLR